MASTSSYRVPRGTSPGAGAGAGPGAGGGGAAPLKGPAFSIPSKNKTLSSSKGGVIGFELTAFSAAARGRAVASTAAKVKASAKAAVLTLGQAKFTAKKGKALTVKIKLGKKGRAYLKQKRTVKVVAVVTAKSAAGGVTTKRSMLTIKAPRPR